MLRAKSGVISHKPLDRDMKILKKIPGPGTYNEERDKIHYKHLNSTIFGKDIRNSFFLKTASFTNPPPGVHQTSFIDKPCAPKFGFGSSSREKDYLGLRRDKLSSSPGPGSYKIPVHVGKTPSFVAMKRQDRYKYV
jgi:hypothetical protein